MKNKKYIIKFLGKKSPAYIKYVYEIQKGYDDDIYWTKPLVTTNPTLITKNCFSDTIEEAEAKINKLLANAKKYLKYFISNRYVSYHGDKWVKNETKRCKTFTLKANYTVEEFVPEFDTNIKRKTINKEWIRNGQVNKYCTCCGTNIPYGKYVRIRQAIICPFCLVQLGKESEALINEEKKKDPDFENDYWASTFIGNMD